MEHAHHSTQGPPLLGHHWGCLWLAACTHTAPSKFLSLCLLRLLPGHLGIQWVSSLGDSPELLKSAAPVPTVSELPGNMAVGKGVSKATQGEGGLAGSWFWRIQPTTSGKEVPTSGWSRGVHWRSTTDEGSTPVQSGTLSDGGSSFLS